MVEVIAQNHFEVNTYILFDETKECVLVDVCSQSEREMQQIKDFVSKNGSKKFVRFYFKFFVILYTAYNTKSVNLFCAG